LNLIDEFFISRVDFTNRFFPPADDGEIEEAEEMLGIRFPPDFITFLRISNGFEGFVNTSYLRLIPVRFIYESTEEYCIASFPWAIYLGTNAGGELVVLDTRSQPFQFGMVPFLGLDDDFIPLGDTFAGFVERIYNDEVFDD
jgi:hypothetical protein